MDLVRDCIKSLLYDKAKSFLAMLSIIVAVITLSLVLYISDLAKQSLQYQIEQLGTDLIIVYVENEKVLPTKWLELIKETALIEMYSYVYQSNHFFAGKQYSVMEVEASYFEIHKMRVSSGRYFYYSDSKLNQFFAVIGSELGTESVFGTGDLVLSNSKYKIIGYLKSKGATLMGNDDEAIFIPYYRHRLNEPKLIQIKSKSEISAEDTKQFLENYLGVFMEKEQFSVYSEIQLKQGLSSITTLLQQVLGFVASLSFVVSLIGIANVMLVSVKQREYEIGILRAIGTSKLEILLRFLLESTVIAVSGFLIGYTTSCFIMLLVANIMSVKYEFSFTLMLTIACISIFTGLIAGIYPAYLATKKEIVKSLHL